jgi:hypothetical protein
MLLSPGGGHQEPRGSSAMNHADIKALAKQLGRPCESLIALARDNDPFYLAAARQRDGEWFAPFWDQLPRPAHYRRVHYVLVSRAGVIVPDGSVYENTDERWHWLCTTVRDAIFLGFVDGNQIIDQRNDPPVIHLVEPTEGGVWVNSGIWELQMPSLPSISFERPTIPQPYHLEVWAEKSTQNDILIPLGEEFRLNIVAGAGEVSFTACRDLVKRAIASGRPVRILYVSDFDPAGLSMPVAAARKIEFEIKRLAPDLDIQVRPVALTYEQCVEFQLPRIPIKKEEKRAEHFEGRFGAGATELDALEALNPGSLRRILIAEIKRYWDPEHFGRCHEVNAAVEEAISEAHRAVYAEFADEIDKIKKAHQGFSDQIKPVWRKIAERLKEELPEIDEYESDFEADEDPDPLFDSTRDYVEQIDRYKRHQGKETEAKRTTVTCVQCGKAFAVKRQDAKFCSKACKMGFQRASQAKLAKGNAPRS